MTNGGNERLDKVEDVLETVKQILMIVARRSEDAEKRMEATDRRINQLSVKVDQLAVSVDETTANVNNLTATVSQQAADADADRSMMVSILEHMDELQMSNARIWQYLMSKDRNGNGSQIEGGDNPA